MLARRLGLVALLILGISAGLIGGWTFWSAVRPGTPPKPMHSSDGIVLDERTAAALIEVVFDAARQDDAFTVSEYLAEGYDPNVRNTRGDTLLTVAAYAGSAKVLETLLAHRDIDLEARNGMGLTAISAAAFKGHLTCLQRLLDAGANVDASNGQNQTAIMFAALSGRTEAVRLLLKAGADPSRVDRQGQSAKTLAETQGAEDVLGVLQSADTPDADTPDTNTPDAAPPSEAAAETE